MVRFVYALKEFCPKEFQKNIPSQVNDEDSLALLKRVMEEYFLLSNSSKSTENYNIAFRQEDEIVIKVCSVFSKMLPDKKICFKETYARYLGVTIRNQKRRKKEDEEEDDYVYVALRDLFSSGTINLILHVYNSISYVPGGLLLPRKKFNNVISKWTPSEYFLVNPDKNCRHRQCFCEHSKLFMCYEEEIQMLLKNPLEKTGIKFVDATMMLIYNMAQRNIELMNYLLNWIAFLMYSGVKTQVCVILYGESGIGKSTLVDLLRKLMAPNYCNLKNDQFENSRFSPSSMLVSQIIAGEELVCDEPNLKLLNELKNAITNSQFTTEKKFKDAKENYNCFNYIITSNGKPVAFADTNDRRFLMLKCDSDMKYNHLDTLCYINEVLEKATTCEMHLKEDYNEDLYRYEPSCCEKVSKKKVYEEGQIFLLSYYFLRLLIKNKGHQPFKNIPLTKLHVETILHNNPLASYLWNMVNMGSNTEIKDKTDFKCLVKNCEYTYEEHFDPENPKWMVHHCIWLQNYIQLSHKSKGYSYLSSLENDYNMKEYSQVYSSGGFTYLFEFPPFKEFKEMVKEKCLGVSHTLRPLFE